MIKIIIPSFNRACQLELLLRSIEKHWNINKLNVHILYKYSNHSFKEGYDKLIGNKLGRSNFNFHKEKDFCGQVKNLIEESQTIGFFTDDCVMFRSPEISSNSIEELLMNPKYIFYSLRLGTNTVIQNYLNYETQPTLEYKKNHYIEWRWIRYKSHYNWSYLFSWDGHFYNTNWLYSLIKDKQFENPRAMEHQLSVDLHLRDNNKPFSAAGEKSSVFVNTINRVQIDGPPAGTKHFYSAEWLNDQWLLGKTISLKHLEDNTHDIISCHEELPIVIENYRDIYV